MVNRNLLGASFVLPSLLGLALLSCAPAQTNNSSAPLTDPEEKTVFQLKPGEVWNLVVEQAGYKTSYELVEVPVKDFRRSPGGYFAKAKASSNLAQASFYKYSDDFLLFVYAELSANSEIPKTGDVYSKQKVAWCEFDSPLTSQVHRGRGYFGIYDDLVSLITAQRPLPDVCTLSKQ